MKETTPRGRGYVHVLTHGEPPVYYVLQPRNGNVLGEVRRVILGFMTDDEKDDLVFEKARILRRRERRSACRRSWKTLGTAPPRHAYG